MEIGTEYLVFAEGVNEDWKTDNELSDAFSGGEMIPRSRSLR